MNYLKEINGFMRFLETTELKPTTQALWFHLMDINNGCSWKEWFTVPNSRLYSRLGVSEKTMIEHRKILIEHGRIEYKPRGTGAGSYHIVSFENTASVAPSPKEPEKPKEEKPTRQEDKPMNPNPFEFFESHFGGTLSPINAQKIGQFIDDHGEEKVIEVMKEAVEKNKKSIGWVSAVLYNPINKGGKQDAKGNAGRSVSKNEGKSKVTPIFGTGRLRRNV
ncbi:DnaD domain protein [Bacillus safensis]|uniref:DnaD domain protein n=1 Tax=Bacillus TaxID=1386 RepID=UPI00247F04CF|nr:MULTISPECIES: DnaD domain protein [Bacillus]MDH6595825.1 DnaD/phage-associated family protein [Bacillus aerius]MEC0921425.1 DnaD domain protein [Bacillus safensis]MEC0997017.1 DnaD domain protein [Bacillus safensis]MEC1000083.1 DnaD domain protein [Bacillus safensis]